MTVLVYIRSLYDYQKFNFAGPYGENDWLEDYTAGVRGEPIGTITVVKRNAAGQAQHIVGNYRPRSTLLLLSRLVGEHLAGTPTGSTSSPASRETETKETLINSSATPEGPGSVSAAPNLPDGFAGTFTSRYIDAGGLRHSEPRRSACAI